MSNSNLEQAFASISNTEKESLSHDDTSGQQQAPDATMVTPAKAPAPSVSSADALDLSVFRVRQNHGLDLAVRKVLVSVRVGKPPPTTFYRVDPRPDYSDVFFVLDIKDTGDSYIVGPHIAPLYPRLITARRFFVVVTRDGDIMLWPITVPGPDGAHNPWHRSAFECAQLAMTRWVRIESNRTGGAYQPYVAQADLEPPAWPEQSFDELVKLAFKDKIITDENHPVLCRLRGAQ
jgi:hypothetical protein